jgi:hypothetical protein
MNFVDQGFGRSNEAFKRRGTFGRRGNVRSRGAGRSTMICYKLQTTRHKSFECLDNFHTNIR